MLDERLFYFIHGVVTMYFLMAGWSRFRQPDASRLKRLCGCILLFWGVLELKDISFYSAILIRDNFLSNLLILIDMTAIPACILFVGELISAGWCTTKRVLGHLFPFLLAVVLYAITKSIWVYNGLFIYATIYQVAFIIYIYFAVKRYHRMLNENYSNVEYMHVNWLVEVIVMLVFTFIVWTFSCQYSSWIVDSCYQLLLMALWILVLHHADRQQTPSVPETLDGGQIPPPLKLPSDGVLNDILVHKLAVAISEEKVWKNPQLTLTDLATRVGTNRTYLSNYLNNSLNTTFYDYINSFRLEAALEILNDPTSTATIIEIAESCGFNSISTFRRAFVRVKGCTLQEYRQKVTADK